MCCLPESKGFSVRVSLLKNGFYNALTHKIIPRLSLQISQNIPKPTQDADPEVHRGKPVTQKLKPGALESWSPKDLPVTFNQSFEHQRHPIKPLSQRSRFALFGSAGDGQIHPWPVNSPDLPPGGMKPPVGFWLLEAKQGGKWPPLGSFPSNHCSAGSIHQNFHISHTFCGLKAVFVGEIPPKNRLRLYRRGVEVETQVAKGWKVVWLWLLWWNPRWNTPNGICNDFYNLIQKLQTHFRAICKPETWNEPCKNGIHFNPWKWWVPVVRLASTVRVN